MPFRTFLYSLISLQALSIQSQELEIHWRRPRVLSQPGHFINFVNNPHDFHRLYKLIYFDACPYYTIDSISNSKNIDFFRWSIFDQRNIILSDTNSTSCLHQWRAPSEGDYSVRLIGHSKNSTSISPTAKRSFFIKDIWYVSLGDSVASGQGNPDLVYVKKSHPALWVNSNCSRSSFGSYSYLIYNRIIQMYPNHAILFTYLACSGATIRQGLLGPQAEQNGQITHFLEPIIKTAQKEDPVGKVKPDLILLSIGANDIGFFELAVAVTMGNLANKEWLDNFGLSGKFHNLTLSLNELNEIFKSNGIESGSVFHLEYFDPLHDEKGNLNSNCANLFFATNDDFRVAYDSVLIPLNGLIRNQSKEFGWNCVDNIARVFFRHGICSKNTYVRNTDESMKFQNNGLGTCHPNYAGHQVITNTAWPRIKDYLEKQFGPA